MMLPGKGFDFGNYKSGFTGAYAMLMDTAREFGDYEIAEAAQRALDQDCGRSDDGGVLRYSKGSNLSNAMAMRARIHRRDDFRRTIAEGPPAASLRGPILTDASIPRCWSRAPSATATTSTWCCIPARRTTGRTSASSACVPALTT